MNEPRPTTNYVIDDAGVLNKTTRKSINDQLSRLEVLAWPLSHQSVGQMGSRPLAHDPMESNNPS